MPELPDEELDYLLSRGRLGREQKKRLLQGILASVAVPPNRRRRWLWQTVGGLSLAAGVAAFAILGRPSAETTSDLRAKGALASAPIVGMACLGGSRIACPGGSRVTFWLEEGTKSGTKEAGFITAYADPLSGGERIWYLTNEPTPVAPSGAAGAPRVIPKAALIGQEQSNGPYRVHVVLTRHPVGHADLPRLTPPEIVTRADFDLVVSP